MCSEWSVGEFLQALSKAELLSLARHLGLELRGRKPDWQVRRLIENDYGYRILQGPEHAAEYRRRIEEWKKRG